MITKSEAKKVAERYLKKRNRNFTSVDNEEKISYFEDEELPYGMFEGVIKMFMLLDMVFWLQIKSEQQASLEMLVMTQFYILYHLMAGLKKLKIINGLADTNRYCIINHKFIVGNRSWNYASQAKYI